MNKIVNFNDYKKSSKEKNQTSTIKDHLDDMKNMLFGDTRTSKEIEQLFSEAKKILRSRNIKKIRIQHDELPELHKKNTIIFEKEKIVFSVCTKKNMPVYLGWNLVRLNLEELPDAISLVTIILNVLGEHNAIEQCSESELHPTGC